MIKKIGLEKLKKSYQGAVESIFHFSFDTYYDPDNMGYSHLRVMNDDIINAGIGFPMHPHQNMEIISFAVEGELTHGDSMGNEEVLRRGEVQYMSAGRGVFHSEFNNSRKRTRIIQIWILPDKKGYTPVYGSYKFKYEDRKNKLLKIVSGQDGDAPIKINQSAEIFVNEAERGDIQAIGLEQKDKVYVKVVEGNIKLNGTVIAEKEAAIIEKESDIEIEALKESLYMIIKMK